MKRSKAGQLNTKQNLSLISTEKTGKTVLSMPRAPEHRYNVVFHVQICVVDQLTYLELHKMSGFGVLPALISAMLWATTLSQYWSVSSTTCSGTPASLQTCRSHLFSMLQADFACNHAALRCFAANGDGAAACWNHPVISCICGKLYIYL